MSQQRNQCTDCKSALQCTTRGHPYHSPKLSESVQLCVNAARDRQTDTQTDIRHRQWWLFLTRNVNIILGVDAIISSYVKNSTMFTITERDFITRLIFKYVY